MVGLSRLTLRVPLDVVTRLLRVAMRSVLLMRRVRMILGLEMLGLVSRTFAIPGHGFSKFESHLRGLNLRPLSAAAFDPSQAGRYVIRHIERR